MSKKDYVKFAKMLEGQKPVRMDTETLDEFLARVSMWAIIVRETARLFQADNSRFDYARFVTACGME
jgi:hypothetical protein